MDALENPRIGGLYLDAIPVCHSHKIDNRRQRDIPAIYRTHLYRTARVLVSARKAFPGRLGFNVYYFPGLLLFFGDKLSPNGFYGNILAVVSGVTSALMIVSMRAQKEGTPAESILIANLFTALFGFPFVLKEAWTITNWLILLYLGLFQIGLSSLLFSKAIKHVPALEANLVGTLEPVLNPVWVFLFLGESMGSSALLGGLIVLGGVAFSAISSAHTARESV